MCERMVVRREEMGVVGFGTGRAEGLLDAHSDDLEDGKEDSRRRHGGWEWQHGGDIGSYLGRCDHPVKRIVARAASDGSESHEQHYREILRGKARCFLSLSVKAGFQEQMQLVQRKTGPSHSTVNCIVVNFVKTIKMELSIPQAAFAAHKIIRSIYCNGVDKQILILLYRLGTILGQYFHNLMKAQ